MLCPVYRGPVRRRERGRDDSRASVSGLYRRDGGFLGADATAYYEAQEAKEVAREGGHMTTSCCPAFYNMVAKHYPALLDKVSHTVSPMVATARYIKKRHPGATVVFIGPCIAKKSEVKRYKDAGKVGADYVLTFDELYAMFLAKNIDPEAMASSDVQQGSKYGKNFATSGGVSAAVQEVLAEEKFDMPVSCLKRSGAAECKKALMLLRVGKLNETIIEGMACEGGCVNGPAKISDVRESVGMRRQLMLSVDDRSIADNLEMSDFKEIDMKDGRN
ncbi:MAG: [Fe-Fe] hydrogenase large subunit C-terminal domain-containing protein [Christensenellales bacterium]